VQKIAIANPDLAPYGRAARAALEKAGLWKLLGGRIVLGQNVAQAAQFVQSGNAQVGFLPLSLAKTPPLSAQGRFWAVPADSYQPIAQAGVVVKGAREVALARELARFVSSDAGKRLLEKYGYDVPAE
jgi:molybdate transport system substrate-binding protein